MTRALAWVLNLDAELELSRGRNGYVAPQKLLAQLAAHGSGARALLGPEDLELTHGPDESAPDRPQSEGLLGRAWCPTPRALEQLRRAGIEPEPHPPPEVLRHVNHRLFAHQLGGGLPHQAYVRARGELERLLAGNERPWLLKRPLAFAGRGQLRVLGPLSDKQQAWIDASLKRDGLVLEPLVEPTLELCWHGFVWQSGRYELGRLCVQEVSARGAFRAVRLARAGEATAAEEQAIGERAQATALALAAAGYFGPFGIDGYRYQRERDGGFCALGEINARYTLGFVTGFPRHPSELRLEPEART